MAWRCCAQRCWWFVKQQRQTWCKEVSKEKYRCWPNGRSNSNEPKTFQIRISATTSACVWRVWTGHRGCREFRVRMVGLATEEWRATKVSKATQDSQVKILKFSTSKNLSKLSTAEGLDEHRSTLVDSRLFSFPILSCFLWQILSFMSNNISKESEGRGNWLLLGGTVERQAHEGSVISGAEFQQQLLRPSQPSQTPSWFILSSHCGMPQHKLRGAALPWETHPPTRSTATPHELQDENTSCALSYILIKESSLNCDQLPMLIEKRKQTKWKTFQITSEENHAFSFSNH